MKTSFGAMTGRERLCFVLKYLFMALCVVVALFPIIWVILSSFKTNAEILSNGISLPTHFGFDGYQSALDMAPIFKFFGNSVIVTCCATVLNVLVFAMAGYAFARFRFPCDKLLYMLLSLSLVIPMTALLQPVYSVVNNLGLYDTKAGLILVNTALNMPMSLLILRNLLKTFGGLVAMNSVTFSVDEASIVGLIGPNGAGKTTTFNIITGNYRPDSGEVIFDRKDITGRPTHKIVELGIARTFQNIRLFQDMSVLENVLAGCHCRMRAGLFPSLFRTPAQRSEERQAVERAMRELAFVGLDDQYANLAGNLAYGNQRLLEIARALASEPRFLILDEPAGGMNDQETADLMLLIKAIQKRGITILLIEHDMNLVMRVCEKIVVLENGALIAEGTSAEIKRNPRVIEAYLGAEG